MTRTPVMLSRSALVPIAITAAMMIFALSAVAQTSGGSSGKITPPPAGWAEKWVGLYSGAQPIRQRPGFNPDYGMNELVIAHLQPWALARKDATDHEVEDPGQLCKPSGPLAVNAGGGFELLVSPEKITVILMGGGGINTGGIRRIHLNRPHLKNPPLTFLGDSVGHWEGETLVVDTIGYNDQTWLSGESARHSEALHIVERWRFVSNGESLEKTYTVDDRFALTSPYSFTRYHKKLAADTPVGENLCEDTPDSRRAWLKIHNRAVKDWEETRRALESTAKKTEGQ